MPSSKNYKRNYKQEAASETSDRKEQRLARNRARYAVAKENGGMAAIKGKDVGHIRALSKGGSNNRSNLRLQDPSTNRSFSRNKDGSIKSERSKKGK
jgi:hypothetical protein